MLKWAAWLLMSAASCATPPSDKVSVVIRNATDQEMLIRAGNGFVSQEVRLKPGESWSGWFDRRYILTSAFIRIEKPKTDP